MGKNNIARFIFQLAPATGSIKCHAQCEGEGCSGETFAVIDEIIRMMNCYFEQTNVIVPLVGIIAQYLTGDLMAPRLDGNNPAALLSSGYLMTPLEYKTMRLLYDFWLLLNTDHLDSWYRQNNAIINPAELRVFYQGAILILTAKSSGGILLSDIIADVIRVHGKLPETQCMDVIELIAGQRVSISIDHIRGIVGE